MTLALTALWLVTGACSRWTPLETAPLTTEVIADENRVRIITEDRTSTILYQELSVQDDSLVGFLQAGEERAQPAEQRVGIPLDEIAEIETEGTPDWLLIGGFTAIVVGGYLLIGELNSELDR